MMNVLFYGYWALRGEMWVGKYIDECCYLGGFSLRRWLPIDL